MIRADLPAFVSTLVGGRFVRWLPTHRHLGDYPGRLNTLQIFHADPSDQARLIEAVDAERARLEVAAGGPLVLLFHSVKQTRERYPDIAEPAPAP
jgi:hypothetical protein